MTVAVTFPDLGYGELTDRYDDVYQRWQEQEELVGALRRQMNARPISEADDPAVLDRLDGHSERARALRTELAELVIARQHRHAHAGTYAPAPV
jgi:hypothetical protein